MSMVTARQETREMKRPSLAVLLSLNAGYVDTVGFLALQGLFTAHVTGNFVTLGATVVLGTGGALAKLLALPVFCIVVMLTRLVSIRLKMAGKPVMRPLLAAKLILFTLAAAYAVTQGPFHDSDSAKALVMGMTLVTAMAIQNALHRVHLSKSPPTTLMTGTTTQIMLDIADIMAGVSGEDAVAARARLRRMATSVFVFAAGCGAAAGAYILSPTLCFCVPPVLAALSFLGQVATPEGD